MTQAPHAYLPFPDGFLVGLHPRLFFDPPCYEPGAQGYTDVYVALGFQYMCSWPLPWCDEEFLPFHHPQSWILDADCHISVVTRRICPQYNGFTTTHEHTFSAMKRAIHEANDVLRSDAGILMPIRLCVAWNKRPLLAGQPLCFNILQPAQHLFPGDPAFDITHVLVAIADLFEAWPLPPGRRAHVFHSAHAKRPHWHLSVRGRWKRDDLGCTFVFPMDKRFTRNGCHWKDSPECSVNSKTVETIENEQDDVGYDYPYELYTDPYNDEIDGECSEQE